MNTISEISNSIVAFIQAFFTFLWPSLLAFLVFVLGLVVASLIRKFWLSLSQFFNLEKHLANFTRYKELSRAHKTLSIDNFIAFVIWWVTIFAFSAAALKILGLNVAAPVQSLFNFVPTLAISAVLIFIVSFAAYLGYLLVLGIGTLVSLPFSNLVAKFFAIVIFSFGLFLLLQTLGISQEFQRAVGFAMIVVVGLGTALALKDPLSSLIKKQF